MSDPGGASWAWRKRAITIDKRDVDIVEPGNHGLEKRRKRMKRRKRRKKEEEEKPCTSRDQERYLAIHPVADIMGWTRAGQERLDRVNGRIRERTGEEEFENRQRGGCRRWRAASVGVQPGSPSVETRDSRLDSYCTVRGSSGRRVGEEAAQRVVTCGCKSRHCTKAGGRTSLRRKWTRGDAMSGAACPSTVHLSTVTVTVHIPCLSGLARTCPRYGDEVRRTRNQSLMNRESVAGQYMSMSARCRHRRRRARELPLPPLSPPRHINQGPMAAARLATLPFVRLAIRVKSALVRRTRESSFLFRPVGRSTSDQSVAVTSATVRHVPYCTPSCAECLLYPRRDQGGGPPG
ncbi:hypothetical protein BJ875DRAFT_438002 [Amylocarpus encephaloides]|uniref:Uncharacterized protein n=1 Tax=Amylocarpus encephaloides TaxID=45428 RepID=A0A9P7YQT6_9HELO|nr:hypothetical protein BJ875DRAFT_438002 [Amylocarpus encephaloides]